MLRSTLSAASLVLLTACGPVTSLSATPPTTITTRNLHGAVAEQATVRFVTDGDTIHVATASNPNLVVRIVGLDTPETRDPRKPIQCFGPQASARAHQLLDGQRVVLRKDPSQAELDVHGRTLRYVVMADGRDYSLSTVADGFARAYKVRGPAPQEWAALVAAQGQAQAAKRGLWSPRPGGCDGGL